MKIVSIFDLKFLEMRLILNISFIVLLPFGCSENIEQNQNIQSSEKMLGEFHVDGMMCERGCKSYIVNKVDELKGVDSCNLDFELQIMTVEYDRIAISSDKIIEHVNSLNDGQYTAKLIQKDHLVLD